MQASRVEKNQALRALRAGRRTRLRGVAPCVCAGGPEGGGGGCGGGGYGGGGRGAGGGDLGRGRTAAPFSVTSKVLPPG